MEEPEQQQLRSRRPRRVAARNQRGAATIPSDDESDAELAAAIAASAREQTMLAGSPEATISSDDDAGPSPGASIPLPPLPSAPHTRPGGTSSRIGTADRGSRISAREKRQRDREEAEARASKRRRTVRRRAEDDYAASEDDDGVDSNVDSEEEYSEGSELDEKVEEEEAEEGDMEDSVRTQAGRPFQGNLRIPLENTLGTTSCRISRWNEMCDVSEVIGLQDSLCHDGIEQSAVELSCWNYYT